MEIFLDEVDSSVVMLIFIFDTVVKMIVEPYSAEVGCWLSGPIFTPITTGLTVILSESYPGASFSSLPKKSSDTFLDRYSYARKMKLFSPA